MKIFYIILPFILFVSGCGNQQSVNQTSDIEIFEDDIVQPYIKIGLILNQSLNLSYSFADGKKFIFENPYTGANQQIAATKYIQKNLEMSPSYSLKNIVANKKFSKQKHDSCLLYTSPSPRDS